MRPRRTCPSLPVRRSCPSPAAIISLPGSASCFFAVTRRLRLRSRLFCSSAETPERSDFGGGLTPSVGFRPTVKRQREKSPVGPLRAGALALLILGFLVLVTLAASGGRPTLHGHLAARPVPNTLQDSWLTLVTIAYGVVIVAVLATLFRRRRHFQGPGSHWLRNYCIILPFMFLFTGIGYFVITHGHFRERLQKQQAAQPGQTQVRKPLHLKALPARQAQFQWPVVFGLGALVVLGVVWIGVRRARRPEATPP